MGVENKNIKIGIDLVFIALKGIEKEEFPKIKENISDALRKNKLIAEALA